MVALVDSEGSGEIGGFFRLPQPVWGRVHGADPRWPLPLPLSVCGLPEGHRAAEESGRPAGR